MKTIDMISASAAITVCGKNLATVGIALATASAIAIAPTIEPPPRPVPAVHLTVASSPIAVTPQAQESNVLGALLHLNLSEFIVPPSAGQPVPSRPTAPTPVSTGFEFEDAIINTYHAIEPWVRYGFEVATYAVGWIPYVGWLSPQIMIFYNFGERIVESLVVNSANWLWGPLPFGEGLANVARDSWNALVQLGIDEWNFWLPPLPPLPFTTRQTQAQLTSAEVAAAADQPMAGAAGRPHPWRDVLGAALGRLLPGSHSLAPQNANLQRGIDRPVLVDLAAANAAANPRTRLHMPRDRNGADTAPSDSSATAADPGAADHLVSGVGSREAGPLGYQDNSKQLVKPSRTAKNSGPSPRLSKNSFTSAGKRNAGTADPSNSRSDGTHKHR
ncbi:hypothetical protein Mycch_2235 [Mycolicibacterium chubuense NBB4]|uniref:Uncharacterized protein n=1 Tax=Mycolicibacterium chubuense (strain NBB4) TaxID=710421 RepID=I4BIA5_MYCCN|nr:hypothetical protein [Mycolicibacterium chubuense]AFM17012.1 hypothetical protein Mycch_2235 [Mycolicibacterium chubuense NBB4]